MQTAEHLMQADTVPVSPMLPLPYRVSDISEEIPGCQTLRLIPEFEKHYQKWTPGQFFMLYVFGHGEVPISVSGNPEKPGELTFSIMSLGSVTQAICRLKPGDAIGLRGPFGSAWPLDKLKGQNIILMAGGLGLAPLRPALYHLMSNSQAYGNIQLLYGTRQPDSIIFADELASWSANRAIEVRTTVDNAGRDWSGNVGVITDLLKDISLNDTNTSALICGPEVMMRFSAYALLDRGLAMENIFISMERNMKCAVRMCGRCQYGRYFICHDGPVFSFDRVRELFRIREL